MGAVGFLALLGLLFFVAFLVMPIPLFWSLGVGCFAGIFGLAINVVVGSVLK